jgi:YfiH family protein
VKSLLGLSQLNFMNQVHGVEIVEVGAGSFDVPTCDALITTERGVGLAVLTADGIPLLINGGSVIAAVHVGRKGLIGGIISKTVSRMRDLGASSFVANLGPAICSQCYEVTPDMYSEITLSHPATATHPALHSLDLPGGAKAELLDLGATICTHEVCTRENLDYFSYRRENITGRIAGVISL